MHFRQEPHLQSLRDYYTITNDGIIDEVKAKLSSLDEIKPASDKVNTDAEQYKTIMQN